MQYRILKTQKILEDHVVSEKYIVETMMDKTIDCETWRNEGKFESLEAAKACLNEVMHKYLFEKKCTTCTTILDEGSFEG